MEKEHTIKEIFLNNNNWVNFVSKYKHKIRPSIIKTIDKLLTCRDTVIGYALYECSNPNCSFIKKIPFTCKCKACSSCGKKTTEIWMQKNLNTFPKTSWQHITFTMPKELWDFFWLNRDLLKHLTKLAAESVLKISNKKNATPAIFVALHTFKRNIGRNVHVHLSTTTGGASKDFTKWIKIFFPYKKLEAFWKYKIITLFRNKFKNYELQLPRDLLQKFGSFHNFLDFLYKKNWIIHCAKPSNDHTRNLEYFSRYTKRPPIAESKIKQYDGQYVTFVFRNHNNGNYENEKITVFEFIKRFIQHIPDKGFRMIKYYGLLANRIKTKAVTAVSNLLNSFKKTRLTLANYAALLFKSFGHNPFICTDCGNELIFHSREIVQHDKNIMLTTVAQ